MHRQGKLDILKKEMGGLYHYNLGFNLIPRRYLYSSCYITPLSIIKWFHKQRWLISMDGFGVIKGHIPEWNRDYSISRDLTKEYLSEQDDCVVDGLYDLFLLKKINDNLFPKK